jgi:hypothetical protein
VPYDSSGVFTRASNTTPTTLTAITVTMHEAEWEDLKTSMNKLPVKDVANTMTASPQRITSTDAGAAETALQFVLYRNSASPQAADLLSRITFTGNDAAGNETVYAFITPLIAVTTDTAEEGVLGLGTAVAGSIGFRFLVRSGMYYYGGVDLGAGTVNATHIGITDGVTAPSTTSGVAKIYVDTADGDLKVIFADGTIKTLATDT